MVTGASTADLALVLVDARNGVVEQSRRHAYLAALLGIRHLVACVNKMDLVDWDEDALPRRSRREFARARPSGSGVAGRRARSRSPRCTATTSSSAPTQRRGTTGRRCSSTSRPSRSPRDRDLDDAAPAGPVGRAPARRPTTARYAGQVAGGTLRAGDEVVVLPAGARTTVDARSTRSTGRVERGVPADVGRRCGSRTTSTSAAAT